MHPTLFDSAWLGLEGSWHFTLSSYVVFIALGYLAAAWLGYRGFRAQGMRHEQVVDMTIWILIAGVLGARAAHVLFDGFLGDYVQLCMDPLALTGRSLPDGQPCLSNAQCFAAQARGLDIGAICQLSDGQCYPQQDCFRWLKFWSGGMTVYGTFFAGLAAYYWGFVRPLALPAGRMFDIAGYIVPLGMAIGRLGCYLAGCCFGGLCHIEALGVRFPSGSLPYQAHFERHHALLAQQWAGGIQESLPVWPTQLLASAYALAIFAVAYFWVRPRKRFDGQVMLVTGILYGLARFLEEFLRDDVRGALLALSTSQWLSLLTVVLCVLGYHRLARRPWPPPSSEPTGSGVGPGTPS